MWLKPERLFAKSVVFTQLWTSTRSLSSGTYRRLSLSRNHLTVWNNSTNQMKQLSVDNFNLTILPFTRSDCRDRSNSLLHLKSWYESLKAAVKLLDWKSCRGPRITKGQGGEGQQREMGISIPRVKENITREVTLCTCYKSGKIWRHAGKQFRLLRSSSWLKRGRQLKLLARL